MKSISTELMADTAILFILSILQNDDNYGYEIVQKVNELTNDEIMLPGLCSSDNFTFQT